LPLPPSVAPGPVAAPRTDSLTIEQLSALKAELWTAGEGRAAVLRQHGLTELQWRLAQRRFVRQIDRSQGDPVRRIVRTLREEVSQRARRER